MPPRLLHFALLLVLTLPASMRAEDIAAKVRKAVERSTLDQQGTKPFHLKAEIAPVSERDKSANHSGSVEMWWESPTRWRREVTSPEFHQIEIVDGEKDWQKNDGDYFPEWLRQLAVALVKPVPPLDHVLEQVRTAEVRSFFGQMNISWATAGSDGTVTKTIGNAGLALNEKTGLILYCGEGDWGGDYKDYQDFHHREVARKVGSAKITVLEDLPPEPPDFFNARALGDDSAAIHTSAVPELIMRKNLIPGEPFVWPPLENGPLEGAMITRVDIDRQGVVRDMDTVVSDNPGIGDAARAQIMKMQFNPYLVNGAPVQVITTITLPFKAVRPAGTENFESARVYFEKGRTIAFPAADSTAPYVLKAEFSAMGSSKVVDKGRYEDTWVSDTQWRREAWFEQSHIVKARNGDTRYLLAEGPDAGLLKLVLKQLEPIPAIDTFVESDWRMKRDTLDAVPTIRVLTGYESPDGKLDPSHARGYWFDDQGRLVKTYFGGIEGRRSSFTAFGQFQIARRIDIYVNGTLGMRISVTDVSAPNGSPPADTFIVKGHEWNRQFTDEVR